MNAANVNHSGVASGVNNSVGRIAGVLSIAVLGIFMFSTFNESMKQQLEALSISPEIRKSIENQTTKLAAMSIPENLDEPTINQIKQIINKSYNSGFNIIMYLIAGLALLSSFVAYSTIGVKTKKGNTT